MKKGLTILIFLIILAIDTAAMTVTLGGPTGTQTTSTINFGCTATAETGETLSSLTLWHNIGGTFKANETTTSATSGTEYTFAVPNVPNGNYEWNCVASNTTDTFTAASNNTFTVSVAANNAPIFTPIPDQIWPENEAKSITLSTYFSDPDGDSLTYTSTTPTNIAVSINGATATLTPQYWHGDATITFTANDGKGGQNSTTANLNATHVNYAPYNKTAYFGNVSWAMGETKKIDLDDYFADREGDTLTFTYTFVSSSAHHINITIANSSQEVTAIPEADWKGTEKVTFTAYDGQGGTLNSNEVSLIVQEGATTNHAPEITSHSPTINPIITVGNSQEFTITPFDQDNDTLTIIWKLDGVEGSSESLSRDKNKYTYLATSEGSEYLEVTASDGEFSETESWNITVEGIAGPPVEPPEEPVTPTNVCGNGQVNSGETCSTCPQDVPCPPGFECKNNKCIREVKQSNWKLVLYIGGGFIIFAAAVLLVYRYYKRKTLFGGWKPKHTGEETNVQLAVKPKEEPAAITPTEKKEMPKFDNKKKTVNEVLLKHFIEKNLKQGQSIQSIKEKLKKVGWSDEKIDDIYKEIQQGT